MKSAKKIVVFQSTDNGLHHLSLSHPHRLPTWEEIKYVRQKFGDPQKFYAIVLPPEQFYVNLHPFCMHLWEVKSEHEVKTWSEMKTVETEALTNFLKGMK